MECGCWREFPGYSAAGTAGAHRPRPTVRSAGSPPRTLAALNRAAGRPRRYASPTDAHFHRRIHQDPAEATTGLVYADWLDEQGRPGLADVVRRHGRDVGTAAHDYWSPWEKQHFGVELHPTQAPNRVACRCFTGAPPTRPVSSTGSPGSCPTTRPPRSSAG